MTVLLARTHPKRTVKTRQHHSAHPSPPQHNLVALGCRRRGSLLLASANNFPRKSEESTYFESNVSMAIAVPAAAAAGLGSTGGTGGGMVETLSAVRAVSGDDDLKTGRTPVPPAGSRAGLGAEKDKEEEEEKEDGKEARQGGDGRGRPEEQVLAGGVRGRAGGGGGGRERSAEVVGRAADPAVLLRPPTVGDGKLVHDRERRLGVASDLEAVIAVSFVPGGRVRAARRGVRRVVPPSGYFFLFSKRNACRCVRWCGLEKKAKHRLGRRAE